MKGWFNVYSAFTKKNIWPRGFPLELVNPLSSERDFPSPKKVSAPIQQGLANENPDVDAIFRMTMPLPVTFRNESDVVLGKGVWSPFNSQNTTWFKEAFPLLYLPSYCSFRMTDIWRSFIRADFFTIANLSQTCLKRVWYEMPGCENIKPSLKLC